MEAVNTKKSLWISLGAGFIALLLFLFILFVTYLPNQPESINADLKEERSKQADLIRAEGLNALNAFELIDSDKGTFSIPIDRAMELTLSDYQK
jgi:hypothetical protein